MLAFLFFFQFSCIATFAQEEDESTSQVETSSSKASEASEEDKADAEVDAKTETKAEAESDEEADDESDLGNETFSKADKKRALKARKMTREEIPTPTAPSMIDRTVNLL